MQAATAVQVADLWGKMQSSNSVMIKETYRQILKVSTLDGVIAPQERELLQLYRYFDDQVFR